MGIHWSTADSPHKKTVIQIAFPCRTILFSNNPLHAFMTKVSFNFFMKSCKNYFFLIFCDWKCHCNTLMIFTYYFLALIYIYIIYTYILYSINYAKAFLVEISKVQCHHLRANSQVIPQPSITKFSITMTYQTLPSNFPGANELIWFIYHCYSGFLCWHWGSRMPRCHWRSDKKYEWIFDT